MRSLTALARTVAFTAAALALFCTSAWSQCTNGSAFGSATISSAGAVVTISSCSFAGEYSTVNGAVSGQTLRFTSSVATDYITVRSGSPAGTLLAHGPQPLVFANTFTGTIYPHWNTNSSCGTQSTCRTTTVQCTSCTPPPAGPGDTCATAENIACGGSVSGTTVGYGVDSVPFCGTGLSTAPGRWYTFIGNGFQATASLCGSSYDTKIGIFTGNCTTPTCITGNDDFCGLQSQVNFPTVNGQQYWILVTGFSSAAGNFTLNLTCAAPPPGDNCATAQPINCGDSITATTVGFAPDTGLPFCGTTGGTAAGRWYQWVGDGSCVTLTTCNAGTNYDTKLHVFTGTACAGFACVVGNDDATCSFSFLRSTVNFTSVPGQQYYILVHGFSTATGQFQLTMTCALPPANDLACGATPLSVGVPGAFNNQCASAQPGEVTPGPGSNAASLGCISQDGWCNFETGIQNSLWYTFVAPASGSVNIDLGASTADLQLAVYEVGDCANFGSYVELAANDDDGFADLSPNIENLTCLVPGQTYYIQLDGFAGVFGSGSIRVQDANITPLAVDAGACQSLVANDLDVVEQNYLSASASGGVGGYQCTWSVVSGDAGSIDYTDGCQAAVSPGEDTVYQVIVTDASGCTAVDTVLVSYFDASCGDNPNKVSVCHVPGGNPDNAHEICISRNAVPAHICLHGGDVIGPCGASGCSGTGTPFDPPPPCVAAALSLTMDSFPGEVSWTFRNLTTGALVAQSVPQAANTTVNYPLGCVDPRHCYEFEILDSFGDGICCAWGPGNYTLVFDGNPYPSPTGGRYGNGESIIVGCAAAPAPAPAPAPAEAKSGNRNAFEVTSLLGPFGKSLVSEVSITSSQDEDLVRVVGYDLDAMTNVALYEGPMAAGETISFLIDNGGIDENRRLLVKVGSSSGALSANLDLFRRWQPEHISMLPVLPENFEPLTIGEIKADVEVVAPVLEDVTLTPVLPGNPGTTLRGGDDVRRMR